MRPESSRSLSLKTKVALSLSLLFTAAIAFVTAVQLREISRSMAEVLAAQQNTLVTRVSDEVDEKFRARRAALVGVAANIGPAIAQDPARTQATLEGHAVLRTMFDSLFIFSGQGQILAGVPYRPELARLSVAQRQYFKDTLASAKPNISAPYRNLNDGTPSVMMTAPVVDANGKVVAILGGSIGLLRSNFLGNIGTTLVGKSGYFYVTTKGAQPIIVSHPDRGRIMGPVVSSTANPTAALARAGFEGTAEGVNSGGVRALMSFNPLKETDWIVAAVLPDEEAFGPIRAAQRRIVGLAGVIAVLIGLLTWILAYWLLVPLASLRHYVHAKRKGGSSGTDLPVRRWDEIGMLTHEFNILMRSQEAAQQALAANEQRLRTITDNLPGLVGYVDREQRYRFNNRAYEEWFGVDRQAFLGKTLLEILGADEYWNICADVEEALKGYVTSREREITVGGRTRIVSSTYMPDYGPEQQVQGFYVLTSDITQQKVAEKELAFRALHDTLTDLPNRAAINEHLSLAIRRTGRSQKQFAVLYLDIDKFKMINDTHGHGIGDQLLTAFAQRLKDTVRGTDVVGRLGGDEFVVLVEDLASTADAAALAEKIVREMRRPFQFKGLELQASTSIGVAVCSPEHAALNAAALLERADAALYQAKQSGRNTFHVAAQEQGTYEPGDQACVA